MGFFNRPDVLPPLQVPWLDQLRPVESADVSWEDLPGGRFRIRVVHQPLPGVTREMLLWWMHHVDQRVEWDGQQVLAYRLWHPRDHIAFQILPGPAGIGPGCRFQIAEAFNGDPKYLMADRFDVPRLDDGGFRIEIRRAGQVVVAMDEDWADVDGGVQWTVTCTFGSTHPVIGVVSRALRSRARRFLEAWVPHNVQEGGTIHHFLPQLYARRDAIRRA